MSSCSGQGGLAQPDESTAMRIRILETVVAVTAARLPPEDLREVAALLVFIAKGSDAAADMVGAAGGAPSLALAGHHAAELLERIALSRGIGGGGEEEKAPRQGRGKRAARPARKAAPAR
ncbi:hypothetical protein ACFQX4_20000 [Roseomonas sp. GCM10028921]